MAQDEAILEAARAIRGHLRELLGADAPEIDRELAALLERADAGQNVANAIVTLLRRYPATQRWMAARLSLGVSAASEKSAADIPERATVREERLAEPPPAPTVDPEPPPAPMALPPERDGTGRRRRIRRRWRSRRSGTTARSEHERPPAAATNSDDIDRRPRWILAQVFDLSDPLEPRPMAQAFRAGADHTVKVRVGPLDDEWFAGEGVAPEDSIDAQLPEGSEHVLAAIFFVPSLGLKQRRELKLPAFGHSNEVNFSLPPFSNRERIEAWISLVFEGRQVQAARLTGFALDDPDAAPDEATIGLQWAALVPGLAEPGVRERFDATVMLDEGEGGVAGIGVPDAEALVDFGGAEINGILDAIRVLLRGLVDAPGRFEDLMSPGSVDLLRELAFQGRALHAIVGEELERALEDRALERVQIIQSSRIDHVPLEFVYDLPTPTEDASLCTGWTEQLANGAGRCPDSNHPNGPLPGQVTKVCPLGFWALSRVIERQIIEARDVRTEGFAIRIAPTSSHSQLAPVGGALFGFSHRLDAEVDGQSTAVLQTLNGVTSQHLRTVDTWKEWASAIAAVRPSLMVLLSHTVKHQGMAALEIGPEGGSGSRLKLIELVKAFVKAEDADSPVVLLLGCDTAVERNEFRSFVGQFLDCGAALVVGTIAPVLGEHAAAVAQSLIREFASALGGASTNHPSTFGELMLQVRRQLLAGGELTALCMTSFGDASWRLASRG